MTAQPGGCRVTVSVLSDVGCRRDVNEDAVRWVEPAGADVLARKGVLVLVADGMGGHSAGEVASRLAVDVIDHAYYAHPSGGRQALADAFRDANRAIFDMAAQDPRLNGMGTTCTALVVRDGAAECAHVGDTRLYLVRAGKIYVMTEDHSAVRLLVARGVLTAEQARHHSDRNVILRALGTRPTIEATVWQQALPVREDDRFVLCSDGLHDLVEDEEIRQATSNGPGPEACEEMVRLAKARGGHDNITVAIVNIGAPCEARDRGAVATRPTEVPA